MFSQLVQPCSITQPQIPIAVCFIDKNFNGPAEIFCFLGKILKIRANMCALSWRRVRHEAGEALGAIGTPECLSCLELFQEDPCIEVAQTCQLALQRIQYYAAQAANPSTTAKDSTPEGSTPEGSSPSSRVCA